MIQPEIYETGVQKIYCKPGFIDLLDDTKYTENRLVPVLG